MQQLLSQSITQDVMAIADEASQVLAKTAAQRDSIGGIPNHEIGVMKEFGLLLLPIPRKYGGAEATWREILYTTKALAKADGSSGQLYANHVTLVVGNKMLGRPEQEEYYFRLTAENNLFWANALNARDARLKLQPDGNHYRANGVKSFGTGVVAADLNVFGAVMDGVDHPMVFILPSDRDGISYNNDWDNMGQRCTASGSYTFNNVKVYADELLGPPPDPNRASTTLVFLLAQLAKTYVYLGIAEGALEAARDYTLASTRPWIGSGIEAASQDPYILQHYGDFWARHQAAIALADQATYNIQVGYDLGTELTWEQRGDIAIAVSAAKAVATNVGLDITSGMFGVMGARATSARYRFDRYWRDLRTFTVHDPVDYKLKAIGDWVLNGVYPTPSQYS